MILINDKEVKWSKFPAGELHLSELVWTSNTFTHNVEVKFENSDDIMALLLVDNLMREQGIKYSLLMKYFPYARQDRHTEVAVPFSLRVMTDIIKLCNISELVVWDAHSDVLNALLPEGLLKEKPQQYFLQRLLIKTESTAHLNYALVSPDAGALKKIYKTANIFKIPVIKADKNRDCSTGNIASTSVHNLEEAGNQILLIADDLVDAGRTFIELSKAIKAHPRYQGNKIYLHVTHGIFSKGLAVFDQHIDKIFCPNVMNSSVNLEQFNERYERS